MIYSYDSYYQNKMSSQRHENVFCFSHFHFQMEVVLVEQGRLEMNINEQDFVLKAHQGILVLPFENHAFASPNDNVCHVIIFPGRLVPDFFQYLHSHLPVERVFPLPQNLEQHICTLLPERENRPDTIHAQSVLMPLTQWIYDHCSFCETTEKYDSVFLSCIDWIHSHAEEPLSLEILAREMGVHPVTMSKKFSQMAGMSFKTYLNSLRVGKSVELLTTGGRSVTEIAYECGFESTRTFHRVFHACYGMTPSEYRLMAKKGKGFVEEKSIS